MHGIGLLDVLRVVSGVLLLNAILSYTITKSSTWGYDGKYVDLQYLRHLTFGSRLRTFTIESLAQSVVDSKRLFVSVNKRVYDVTASRGIYDPKLITARYSMFVGKDCTRMYVNGCFRDIDQCSWDTRNIGYDQTWVDNSVNHWVKFYDNHSKYWLVGYLEVDESIDPPKECMNGVQYPR